MGDEGLLRVVCKRQEVFSGRRTRRYRRYEKSLEPRTTHVMVGDNLLRALGGQSRFPAHKLESEDELSPGRRHDGCWDIGKVNHG